MSNHKDTKSIKVFYLFFVVFVSLWFSSTSLLVDTISTNCYSATINNDRLPAFSVWAVFLLDKKDSFLLNSALGDKGETYI